MFRYGNLIILNIKQLVVTRHDIFDIENKINNTYYDKIISNISREYLQPRIFR